MVNNSAIVLGYFCLVTIFYCLSSMYAHPWI